MRSPDSYYSDTVSISIFGIVLLVAIGLFVLAFIIFRNKLPTKLKLYVALLLTLLVGFTIGITVDELALAKDGSLTRYHREKIPESEIPVDNCINC